jgi:hypothetical protein
MINYVLLFSLLTFDGPHGICENKFKYTEEALEMIQTIIDGDAKQSGAYEIQLDELCNEM